MKKTYALTREHRMKISRALLGNKNGIGKSGPRGYKHTEEWKKTASLRMIDENKKRILRGTHNLWKGGVTPCGPGKRKKLNQAIIQ